jgi:ribosome modulation factor
MCLAIKKGRAAYAKGVYRGQNPYARGSHNYVMWLRGWREAETDFFWKIKN